MTYSTCNPVLVFSLSPSQPEIYSGQIMLNAVTACADNPSNAVDWTILVDL